MRLISVTTGNSAGLHLLLLIMTPMDADGILNSADLCSLGSLNWISSTSTDHDSDGCLDGTEDLDDDNDLVLDATDVCALGEIGQRIF